MKVTSAYANKLLKQLEEEKAFWTNKEKESFLYTAAVDEEPVIPEYDFLEVNKKLSEIDLKVCRIKHAVNVSNASASIDIGGEIISVDVILIRMSQLSKRRNMLDKMRKQLPKARVNDTYGIRKGAAEYRYANYDIDTVKAEYEAVGARIMEMQMALDKHNQTEEFDVEI